MYGRILGIVCAIVGVSWAVPPTLSPQGSKIVGVGEELVLECSVDTVTDINFLLKKQVLFVFKSNKTGEEAILSSTGSLRSPYDNQPDHYELAFTGGPPLTISLILKNIQLDMDGKYICRTAALGNDDQIFDETALDVSVAAGISDIKMTVDGQVSGTSVTLDKGTYPVTCEAKGSNPEAVIHMHLGAESLDAGVVTSILDTDSTLEHRSFKTSVNFELDFDHKSYGKKLSCHAETVLPDGMSLTLDDAETSMILEGNIVEPIIHCFNKTASKGDKRLELTCYVASHTKIKKAMFNINNDIILYPGNKTDNHDEVIEKDHNATHTVLVLKIYEVTDFHIDATIYLDVIGLDGMKYQYRVGIIKGVSAAPRLVSSALTLPGLVLLAMCLGWLIQ